MIKSAVAKKLFHLRLRPRCHQVQAASGRTSWSATSRGFTTPRVGVICHLLSLLGFFGSLFWGFPGLVFCGCLRPCVCVCLCGCVCVCLWCSVLGPSWSLLRFCFACANAVVHFVARPRVSVCWGLARGRFSSPVSWGFLQDLARHIGGRTSPRLVRSSVGSPPS